MKLNPGENTHLLWACLFIRIIGKKLPDSQASVPFLDPAARLFPKPLPFSLGAQVESYLPRYKGHDFSLSPQRANVPKCPTMMARPPSTNQILTCLPGPAQAFLKPALPVAPPVICLSIMQPVSSHCLLGPHITLDLRFLLVTPKCKSTACHIWLPTQHPYLKSKKQFGTYIPHRILILGPQTRSCYIIPSSQNMESYSTWHHDFSIDLAITFCLILHVWSVNKSCWLHLKVYP